MRQANRPFHISVDRKHRAVLIAACLFAVLGFSGGAVRAQDSAQDKDPAALEKASQAESAKAKAVALEAEAVKADVLATKVRLVGLARKTRESEQKLATVTERLESLEAQADEQTVALEQTRRRQFRALAGLVGLAMAPRQALLIRAGDPVDLLRGAALLRTSVPALKEREIALSAQEARLAALLTTIKQDQDKERIALAALAGDQEHLAIVMQEKRRKEEKIRTRQSDAAARAESLAREAKDLRDLLARISAEQRVAARQAIAPERKPDPAVESTESEAAEKTEQTAAPQTTSPNLPEPANQMALAELRDFEPGPDSLVMPLQGAVRSKFGQRLKGDHPFGAQANGLLIRGRPGSQVLSPFDGQVVYAGPFRSFGLILIIDHGASYHSLLAGLGRIDVVVDQSVLAGEPLGTSSAKLNYSELYLELRHAGEPVDPLPWITRTGSKVRG